MKNRYWLVALVVMFSTIWTTALAGTAVSVYVNNSLLQTDVPAQIVQGRVLVPVRVLAEGLGARVEWHSESQSVMITRDGPESEIPLKGRWMYGRATTVIGEPSSPLRLIAFLDEADALGDTRPFGKPIKFTLSVHNVGKNASDSTTLKLRGYVINVHIAPIDESGVVGTPVWRGYVTGGPTELELYDAPGFSFLWDQTEMTGAKVPKGRYVLTVSATVTDETMGEILAEASKVYFSIGTR